MQMDIKVERFVKQLWLTVSPAIWRRYDIADRVTGPVRIIVRGDDSAWYFQNRIIHECKIILTEKW